jgi:UDP-N-acetyl-D-galactosamine dehydrogenase
VREGIGAEARAAAMTVRAEERFAVIGLGYVGLPVALAFARRFRHVVGFDIDHRRVAALAAGEDATGEIGREEFVATRLAVTSDPARLKGASFFIVAVPTPIDGERRPDLGPLASACEIVGRALGRGAVVVFESTVYPGLTEEFCGTRIEGVAGLVRGRDFTLGYSPERINPGDRAHRLETVVKVVAGEDAPTLERVAAAYGAVVEAGIHRAPSIAVAEAAKVIENAQRDLNIALMNEVAMICGRLGIATRDVLAAAQTKWNFLPFAPGLVGGHCIGVDPYYLTARAEALGYHPQVILAGRRINDAMGAHVAQALVKLLIRAGHPVREARIGIFGLTFKENIRDLRNSRVLDIVAELGQFGVTPLLHDPYAPAEEVRDLYRLPLVPWDALAGLDGLVLAVAHEAYAADLARLFRCLRPGGVFMDVKSLVPRASVPAGTVYWCL